MDNNKKEGRNMDEEFAQIVKPISAEMDEAEEKIVEMGLDAITVIIHGWEDDDPRPPHVAFEIRIDGTSRDLCFGPGEVQDFVSKLLHGDMKARNRMIDRALRGAIPNPETLAEIRKALNTQVAPEILQVARALAKKVNHIDLTPEDEEALTHMDSVMSKLMKDDPMWKLFGGES